MVLILSFLACIKQPTYDSALSAGNTAVELPTVAILENEKGITPIPPELQNTLSNRLQKRNITLQFYDHTEKVYKELWEARQRLVNGENIIPPEHRKQVKGKNGVPFDMKTGL